MDTAARARQLALAGIETRAYKDTQGSSAYNDLHPHVASGPTGGQFAPKGDTGSPAGYKSILPPASAYNSGGGGGGSTKPTGTGTPQAPSAPRTMQLGDSGEDVRYAQYAMSLLGFKVNQDGHYDQATVDAVKQMQERLGVKKPNGHLSAAQLHKLQDAVRLSPCIGAGQRDLAFEAQWEQRDAEPDPEDDDLDEMAQAILEAIDEHVRSLDPDWDERAHDVSGELRLPSGGKGGGRWTKSPITQAIAHALEEWAKGNGPDDPFQLDGKPIDREPLRKAAVARGVTLKRGASRDDIVKALLDDVRQAKAGEKAATPKGAPADHRQFTIKDPNGAPVQVGIFGNPTTGKLSLYRESDAGKRQGRAIRSFDDMAALESWARDNGHTSLADYAKAEQARTSGPKTASKASVRDELAKAGVDVQSGSLREAAVKAAESGNTADLHKLAKHLRAASQTKRSLASMRLGNNAPGSLQHNKGQDDLDEAGRLEDAAKAVERLAGSPVPKESFPPSVHEPKRQGGRVANLPPVQVHVDASSGSDTGRWRATHVEGLTGSQSTLLAAVTDRVRTSARLANGRLRTPDKPLHNQSIDELLGRVPIDTEKAAKAAATADRHIAAMDKAMEQSPLPSDAVLWRGIRPADIGLPDGDATGFEWTDPAYVGTSGTRNVAEGSFAQGALLRVHAPSGTRAIGIQGGGEHEVLLDRGQRFRVVADRRTATGARELDVEVVPKAEQARTSAPTTAGTSDVHGVLAALEADLRKTPAGRRKTPLGGASTADNVASLRQRLDSGELKPGQVDGLLQRLLFQARPDSGYQSMPGVAGTGTGDQKVVDRIHAALSDLRGTAKPSSAAKVAKAAPAKAAKKAATVYPATAEEAATKAPAVKADPLAGLEGLTTVQKRAKLRARGLSKAEIDGLVPLTPKKAAATAPKSVPTVADSPHVASLKSRLAAIGAEAKPITDEVLKRQESAKTYSHNENMDLYRRIERLKALREEGSRAAHELLDALGQRDGEPWGGDPATDATRWEAVRPAGSLIDRGTVDPATWQKLRDVYLDDQKTLEHNASLRSGNPTPAARAWASKASQMVNSSELTHDTKLARGAALLPETVMQLRPGAVIHDRGIVSTAETGGKFDEAKIYMRDRLENNPGTIPTMFEIRAPKGTPAAQVGYGEVVLDRDGRFRVVSSRMGNDGVVHVVMELIGK